MSILNEICDSVRERVEVEKESNPLDLSEIENFGHRSLEKSIKTSSDFAVIGELKKASPSAGKIREDFQVSALAKSIAGGGAVGISILTEPDYFDGKLDDLEIVRDCVDLPVLRKDFIVDEYQLLKSAEINADAVLLISNILKEKLSEFVELAQRLELEPLVEVDNQEQAELAVETGANLIGVNNRDLRTMEINISKTEEISKYIPSDRTLISESGIKSEGDIEKISDAGADGALVGTGLMEVDDVKRKVRSLVKGVAID